MASPIITTTDPTAPAAIAPAAARRDTPVEAEAGDTTGAVRSSDGTVIGFRRIGSGPGVIVVHGAMESSQSHIQLAEALAGSFSVYLVDRRGRGLSGPFSSDHSLAREVEDVLAVAEATGARNLFGVSSGGVVALQAALSLPSIARVALYEPALVDDPAAMARRLDRYEREIASGKVAAALVTAMKVSEMGPRIFNLIPSGLMTRMTASMLAKEDRSAVPGAVTMRTLAPTLHYDFADILEASARVDDFAGIRSDLLLLGGSKSPAYLRRALDRLERILPAARRVEFRGLGHGGSGDSDWGGKPAVVAAELARFFC